MYRPSLTERNRMDEAYAPFTAIVLTADYERKVLTLQDDKTTMVYTEVRTFPAMASSLESTDASMPEPGTKCIAVNLTYSGGFSEVAVVSWLLSNTLGAIDAVAVRGPEGVGGWTQRRRGTYRKAYPGQKTITTTSGFSEKIDEGWDRLGSDFSRDKVDALRREWTQITSRQVRYSDAGLSFEGPVNRPPGTNPVVSSASIPSPTLMPDGTLQYVMFLNPTAGLQDRYISGTQDVLPIAEKVEKIQEFALDYPVPQEILQTEFLDTILGTTASPAALTSILKANVNVNGTVVQVDYDNETFMINQPWDNPQSLTGTAVGPTTNEGVTPARRGFMIEKSQGTLVGSNFFDPLTYGSVLQPILNPATYMGRFGADIESGYLPVPTNQGPNYPWTRLAASGYSVRFPYEYNTTRWDVTKEGMLIFEVGSSIPKEKNPFGGGYEYVHGAGRSIEGHLVGSLKLVIGKDRDEEDALDLQALGQSVLRFGADDCSLPDSNRIVLTQNRGDNDAVEPRRLQYWAQPKLNGQGDPVSLTNKVMGENVSIRAATDGGVVMRFGARVNTALRRHLANGYQDPQGVIYVPPPGASGRVPPPGAAGQPDTPAVPMGFRIDSKSPGRPTYGAGDSLYQFHNLANAGAPSTPGYASQFIYQWSGTPVNSMDRQGLSIDFHTVRDILIRAGKDTDHGQSLLMDLAGGMVAWFGADTEGRSITATLDGGVQMSIGRNTNKGLQLDIVGDLNVTVKGNYHLNVTGGIIEECDHYRRTVHTDVVQVAMKVFDMALAEHVTESPNIVNSQPKVANVNI
jgi:hypothetical protein